MSMWIWLHCGSRGKISDVFLLHSDLQLWERVSLNWHLVSLAVPRIFPAFYLGAGNLTWFLVFTACTAAFSIHWAVSPVPQLYFLKVLGTRIRRFGFMNDRLLSSGFTPSGRKVSSACYSVFSTLLLFMAASAVPFFVWCWFLDKHSNK